ncbi:unnamed protein product [Pieris macdunnoughi]|uniref:Uncharacterized protein n=1 Tax=Pieris macdunnoughi TaxID=345717 RepID=A0A821N154_9NEOP|nr:unnamed protein product [Pieris macdunnoughi]
MGRYHKLIWIVNVWAVVIYVIDAKPTINYERKTPDSRDLDTAGSSYSHQYYDWGGNNPGGYSFGVTGNGVLDDPRLEYDSRPNTINDGYYPEVDKNNYNRDVGYHSLGGFGGYGGNGGNGGLNSYYGYNNPHYQEANHLGFGYYKKFGNGNIYSSGVTPNLVVGYRGYSRR